MMLNKKLLSRRTISRRNFIKGGTVLGMSVAICPAEAYASTQGTKATVTSIINNPLGFNGQYQDPVTKSYFLGNGYRLYRPTLMRFNACDNLSPFGRGGVNSYAYCLGDPVNKKDPSGHFALMSIIIGAIIGAVVGAGISAVAEGIRAEATNTDFDWKEVAIGAALGFVSGGFGGAASGAKASVQLGLTIADSLVSSLLSFGIDIGRGASYKDAGISAGIGGLVGLASFGIGTTFKSASVRLKANKAAFKTYLMPSVSLRSKAAIAEGGQLRTWTTGILIETNNSKIAKIQTSSHVKRINANNIKLNKVSNRLMSEPPWYAPGKSYQKYYGKKTLSIFKDNNKALEDLFSDSYELQIAVLNRPNSSPLYKYLRNVNYPTPDSPGMWRNFIDNYGISAVDFD